MGVYHCISRCVRRAFLCGLDSYTGKNYEHRREWVQSRLKDLSWFMRCLNESLAKRANREDRCTGRFWEGRFKCQRLMDEETYMSLVEWTGRNIRVDKPGYIPVDLEKVLDRFELDAAEWAKNVATYGSLFHRIAGRAEQLAAYAGRKGQSWFRGRSGGESLYRCEKKAA